MKSILRRVIPLAIVMMLAFATARASEPTTYYVRLTGAEANSCNGNDTPNWGYGIITLSADSSTVSIYLEHTIVDPIVAHLHQGPKCVIGPPRFFMDDATSPIDTTIAIEPYDVEDFLTGNFYLLVHSDEFVMGEIRGQAEDGLLVCGDASGDDAVNVGDAVYLINHIFKNGLPPIPGWTGDANCDGQVNVGDAVYLIVYIFNGGPEPCCP